MPDVSRECIRDTLLLKRQFGKHIPGLYRAIYNLGIQNLRSGQLAPHSEQKMRAGRFLDRQNLMRAAPEIVVVVRGGRVEEVRSTNPYTGIYVADYDFDHEDRMDELNDAEERGNAPDMHIVY